MTTLTERIDKGIAGLALITAGTYLAACTTTSPVVVSTEAMAKCALAYMQDDAGFKQCYDNYVNSHKK